MGTCATVIFTNEIATEAIVQSGPGCIYADVLVIPGDSIDAEDGVTVLTDEAGNPLLVEL